MYVIPYGMHMYAFTTRNVHLQQETDDSHTGICVVKYNARL